MAPRETLNTFRPARTMGTQSSCRNYCWSVLFFPTAMHEYLSGSSCHPHLINPVMLTHPVHLLLWTKLSTFKAFFSVLAAESQLLKQKCLYTSQCMFWWHYIHFDRGFFCYSAGQGNLQWKSETANMKKLSSNSVTEAQRLWKQGWVPQREYRVSTWVEQDLS